MTTVNVKKDERITIEPITFPLTSSYHCLDINQRNQLMLLHDDPQAISMYTADSVVGFKKVWTRKLPKAAIRRWNAVNAKRDGGILVHETQQETLVLDGEASEVSRWPTRLLFLMAANSNHVVYLEGEVGGCKLHVHDASDHLTRLFSLVPEGEWSNPSVTIIADGRFYVMDLYKCLLVAFSPTGKRMYQREVPYKPGVIAISDQNIYVQDQNDLTMLHIHELGSGQLKKKKFTRERLGLGEDDQIRKLWTGEGGKLHVAVFKGPHERIITYTNLTPCK